MKRLFPHLLLLFSPLLLSGSVKDDFSRPSTNWKNWKNARMAAEFSHSSTVGATACGALQITLFSGGPAKNSAAFTSNFPAYAGRQYRSSVMVKGDGLAPETAVFLSFQGKNFQQNFLKTAILSVKKTGQELSDGKWHKLEFSFTIPTDGKWAQTAWVLCCLGVENGQQGKVYFDDFRFETQKLPASKVFKMPSRTPQVTLVSQRKAASMIVIPESPLPLYPLAAEELQLHIQMASGVALPIYTENKVPQNNTAKIYLGPCRQTRTVGIDSEALPPSGWLLGSVGKDLYITGRDRSLWGTVGSNWNADWQGTLYGVYAFLRHEMGVRWIFPGKAGMVVPQKTTITFSGKKRSGRPKLLSSQLLGGKCLWIGWKKQEAAEKFFKNQARFLLRHGFQSVENMNYSHNYGNYWKRFSKSHPEYFALVNPGTRKQLKGDSNHGFQISLCMSSSGLQDQAIKDWVNRPFQIRMARPYLSVMLNDTPEMCTCKGCRAWDYPDPCFQTSPYWGKGKVLTYRERWQLSTSAWGEDNASGLGEPSLSDRYARFCLAMQAKAQKIDPDVTLIGFAYTNYVRPPREVKLNKGIIIQNVFGLWYPYTREMSRKFRQNWQGWNKTGARQMLRPNLLHAGGHVPVFYARRFAEDFRWAYQNGLTASYMDTLTGAWAAQNPNLYIICRIHENPELDCDTIIDEYTSTFGKAKDIMRRYVAFWEKRGDALTIEQNEKFKKENALNGRHGGTFQNYALIAHEIAPLSVLDEARKILAEARQAARNDPAVITRISFLDKGLQDAAFIVKTRLAQIRAQKEPTAENKARFAQAFAELQNFRAGCEDEGIINCGIAGLRERFGCNWPWKDNRTRKKK